MKWKYMSSEICMGTWWKWLSICPKSLWGFPSGSAGKESICNAGDTEVCLIPGLGRSFEEGNGNHSSILAWKIPWTEEPGRLQFNESQRVIHDWAIKHTQNLFDFSWTISLLSWLNWIRDQCFQILFYFTQFYS